MGIIDMHTHYLPASYVAALERHVPGDPDGWATPKWTTATTLHFNHQHDISYALLSLSSPHINFGDKAETLQLARDANELGEKLAHEHGELGYAATLPLPYADDAVAEIDWALAHGSRGFTVPTNTRGVYFGSPILDPVYERLNAAKAIVMLHPNQPAALPQNVNIDLPTPLMGFFMDTTMTFMNLLKYHFFDRFPDIRLIVPHAGAFLGILADRDAPYVQSAYQADLFAALRHVYFDVAGAVMPRQLPMLLTLADPNHVMYGSDIPYTDTKLAGQLLGVLTAAGDDAIAKRVNFFQSAHRLDGLFRKFKPTKDLPTTLDQATGMMTGSAVLPADLRTKILTTNAEQLLH